MNAPPPRSPLLTEVTVLLSSPAAALRGTPAESSVSEIVQRLHEPLRVAIAGRVKAGKSTLLNALIGDDLAPTDAGLGAATVLNPVVPVRVRRVLNVESGLNDGLATPVVLFAIATLTFGACAVASDGAQNEQDAWTPIFLSVTVCLLYTSPSPRD